MPIALTLMRTSAGPGAGTVVSMNSRTSGPPTFANLIVRDIGISCVRGKRKGRLAGSRVVCAIRLTHLRWAERKPQALRPEDGGGLGADALQPRQHGRRRGRLGCRGLEQALPFCLDGLHLLHH